MRSAKKYARPSTSRDGIGMRFDRPHSSCELCIIYCIIQLQSTDSEKNDCRRAKRPISGISDRESTNRSGVARFNKRTVL